MNVPPHSIPHFDDDRTRIDRLGNVFRQTRNGWRPARLEVDKDGYRRFVVKKKHFLVHREVYRHFVGPIMPGRVVCHLDGVRWNNSIDNLTQATQKQNIAHKVLHGTHQQGENHGRAKYSDELVARVKRAILSAPRSKTGRIRRGESKNIAVSENVPVRLVNDLARNRKAWDHV